MIFLYQLFMCMSYFLIFNSSSCTFDTHSDNFIAEVSQIWNQKENQNCHLIINVINSAMMDAAQIKYSEKSMSIK